MIEKGVSDPYKKFSCILPGHEDDKDPSVSLHKSGIFITCFGKCMASYDIFSLASKLEDFPVSGPEFVTGNVLKLADRFDIKYSIAHTNEEKSALKYNYFRAYKLVADFIEAEAKNNPTEAFNKELTRRKWSRKDSIEYGLGCCNKYKDIIDLLHRHDFTNDFIETIGLNRADVFSPDNVIFTIRNERNYVCAFYARDVKFEEKKIAYEKSLNTLEIIKPKQPIKYNSTANFTGIYEKPLCPYGISDVKDFHKVILVEGHGCKHSLKLNDVHNVIALGGLALSDATIDKLISLGTTAIVLALDNDDKGIKRIKEIITKYYGKKSIDWYVIDLSSFTGIKDIDELIRKYSIDTFKQIPERNALEWFATQELYEKSDIYAVVESIAPLIALERSPINRLKIESIIADMTEISKDIIHAEVEQRISTSNDRKSEYALKIFDEAKELISMNPDALSAAINLIETKVGALNSNSNDEELFSSNECLKAITAMEDVEDSGEISPTILTGITEIDEYSPIPTSEAFILVPSSPNAGKSSLFVSLVNNIVRLNENAMCIIHTIDDSRSVYVNRLIANLTSIQMNWIKNPTYFLDKEMNQKRKEAYKLITNFVRDERIVIKDSTHRSDVEYHENLIKYYRKKYPNRNIVVFCDNFHKLTTEMGYDDNNIKYQYISEQLKKFTNKYDCVEICTVELNKMDMYKKHTDANTIKSAGSLQYDANMILFLWNEINSLREEAELVFDAKVMEYNKDSGYFFIDEVKPIVEGLILKNKFANFKKSIYFKFHPELAIYESITTQEAKELVNQKKQLKLENKEIKIHKSEEEKK